MPNWTICFSELTVSQPKIDVLRRGLQRAYLDHLKSELVPKDDKSAGIFGGGDSTDFRAVARVSARRLQGQVGNAITHTKDPITLAHLEDCKRELDAMVQTRHDIYLPSAPPTIRSSSKE